ncbi:MAG TPA: DNA polymerase III subunit delta' [Rubrivivax sp.]|nr:DNA polymerase III subunit delta' [Rubrivivax sp.]
MVVGPDGQLPLPWLEAPLRDALAQRRGHALLVQAADGVGAMEFMLALAQGWLCEAPQGARPCGRCDACRLLQARSHSDLLLLLPEALRVSLGWAGQGEDDAADGSKSRRKPSRQIRIDEVRSAIDWVAQSSARGRAKVVLIHPAGALNLQAASALLKTLEEPPGQARLLLSTTDEASLLPTVRSRCQRIRLTAPPHAQAVQWLQAQGVGDAAVLLAAAGGAPLAARELAAAGIDAGTWSALPRAVSHGRAQVLAGWPLPRAIDALHKLCHDAMLAAVGGAPRYFAAQAVPPGATLPALVAWRKSLSRAARHDEHPWNEALLLEALVLEGRACWQEATTAAARGARGGRGLDTLAR